jgi:hypothetical protein
MQLCVLHLTQRMCCLSICSYSTVRLLFLPRFLKVIFLTAFHQVVRVQQELHFHIRGYLSESNTLGYRRPSLGVHECDGKHDVIEARFVVIHASLQKTDGFDGTVAIEMGMSWGYSFVHFWR